MPTVLPSAYEIPRFFYFLFLTTRTVGIHKYRRQLCRRGCSSNCHVFIYADDLTVGKHIDAVKRCRLVFSVADGLICRRPSKNRRHRCVCRRPSFADGFFFVCRKARRRRLYADGGRRHRSMPTVTTSLPTVSSRRHILVVL